MFKKVYPQWQFESNEVPYKKFDFRQFNSGTFSIRRIEIEPDESGYCTNALIDSVEPYETELVVTNCPTGSGKSTFELHQLGEYYRDGYIIIKVSPGRSLVRKEYEYVIKGDLEIPSIPAEDIVLYDQLSRSGISQSEIENLASKPVHVMTVSCFLGNSGREKNQKREKRVYLNAIIKHAASTGKKVVLFIDELHEAMQYFRQGLFQNIIPWIGIIHKVFASTATFSESCFPAIKHLAILVENQILLLESRRITLPVDRRAELEIYFASRMYARVMQDGDIDLNELSYVHHQIAEYRAGDRNYSLHILCYSRRLAIAIYKSGWVDGLDVNLTVGKRKNRFIESRCNLGTTFSSGVNIKEKDLLIVILPPNPEAGQDTWGIFDKGAIPVQQAMGRLRNGGKIIVFVPPLKKVISGEYELTLKSYLPPHLAKYTIVEGGQIPDEYEIISKSYNRTGYPVSHMGVESVLNPPMNENLPPPTFDMVQILHGDDIVVNTIHSSGKLVYPYFIAAACSGEFIACKLPSFVFREYRPLTYNHNPDMIEESIEDFIRLNYEPILELLEFDDIDEVYSSLYSILQGKIVKGIQVIIKANVQPNLQSVEFKRALLSVIMRRMFGLTEITLGSFIAHRLLNDANNRYTQLFESIIRIQNYAKATWESSFPKSPKVMVTDLNFGEIIKEFGVAVEKVFENDPILQSGIWSMPWKSGNANSEQIFKFIRKYFVVGSRDSTRDNIRIMRVDHYVIDRTWDRIDSIRIDGWVQVK